MVRRRVGVGRLPKWWCLVSARATIVTTDDFGIRDAVDGVGATCLSVSRSSGRTKNRGQSAKAPVRLTRSVGDRRRRVFDYGLKRSNVTAHRAVSIREVWLGMYKSYGMIAVRV